MLPQEKPSPKEALEKKLSAFFSRWFKEHFGRGPELIHAKIYENNILVKFHGFLSVAEQTMCRTESGIQEVKTYRGKIMKIVIPKMRARLPDLLGIPVTRIFCDCDPPLNEGIICIILEHNLNLE